MKRIAVFYIQAGKGHEMPAKAIAAGFRSICLEADALDFYKTLGDSLLLLLCRKAWRLLLFFPPLERVYRRISQQLNLLPVITGIAAARRLPDFIRWFREYRPDIIISCNSVPLWVLPRLLAGTERTGLPNNCIHAAYNTDIFYTLRENISSNVDYVFSATQEGLQHYMSGFSALYGSRHRLPLLHVCPFPLRSGFSEHGPGRHEARMLLGLADMPSICVSMGGEGIGSLRLIEAAASHGIAFQFIVLGNLSKRARKRLTETRKAYSSFRLHIAGMVDDPSPYLRASNLVAGKAGANTIAESLFVQRPFLITEHYHLADQSAEYLRKYHVGWYCTDTHKQISLLKKFLLEPVLLKNAETACAKLPMRFGAKACSQEILTVAKSAINQSEGQHAGNAVPRRPPCS